MDNYIETILDISNQLDDAGNEKLANALDSLAAKLLQVKTAQYVGSQGYWIRNTRCWMNCYRQKRAENPGMAAQKVWESCHKSYLEYIDSHNKGKSAASWDKYASTDSSFVKTAAHDQSMRRLAELIDQNIAEGLDKGRAIFASLDQMEMEPYDKMIEASDMACKIASKFFTSNPKESVRIAELANDITKEAQLFQRMKNRMMQPARGLGQIVNPALVNSKSQTTLLNRVNKMEQHLQGLVGEYGTFVQEAKRMGLTELAGQVQSVLQPDQIRSTLTNLNSVKTQVNAIVNRETGDEKGNIVQRGLNWVSEQADKGRQSAQNNREFWERQQRGNSQKDETLNGLTAPQQQQQAHQRPDRPAGATEPQQTEPTQPQPQPQTVTEDKQQPAQAEQPNTEQQRPIVEPKMYKAIRQLAPNRSALRSLFVDIGKKLGIANPESTLGKVTGYKSASSDETGVSNPVQTNEGISLRDLVINILSRKNWDELRNIYYAIDREMLDEENQERNEESVSEYAAYATGSPSQPANNAAKSVNKRTKVSNLETKHSTNKGAFNLSKVHKRRSQ